MKVLLQTGSSGRVPVPPEKRLLVIFNKAYSMSSPYIENNLPAEAANIHRALASLQEELEAVDYYNQRAALADDAGLKDILIHNRNEEIEHSAMLLEWLRRQIPEVDKELRAYLFTRAPVTEIEDGADGATAAPDSSGSLGIGKLS